MDLTLLFKFDGAQKNRPPVITNPITVLLFHFSGRKSFPFACKITNYY